MEVKGTPQEAITAKVESYTADKKFVTQVGSSLRQQPDARALLSLKIAEHTRAGLIEGTDGESVAAYVQIGRANHLLTDEQSISLLDEAHTTKAALLRDKAQEMPYARSYFMTEADSHEKRAKELRDLKEPPIPSPQVAPIIESRADDFGTSKRLRETEHGEDEIQDIVNSVIDTTVAGKFPNGAYLERKKDGRTERKIIAKPSSGFDDYTSGGSENIYLHSLNSIRINIDKLREIAGVITEKNRSTVRENPRDFLYIADFRPSQNLLNRYPEAAQYMDGNYSTVMYSFPQEGGDRTGRALGFVEVLSLLPKDQARRLVEIVKDDPNKIKEYYKGVAPGLEGESEGAPGQPSVKPILSKDITIVDVEGQQLPIEDPSTLSGDDAYNLGLIVNGLDGVGEFPRLAYATGKQVESPLDTESLQRKRQYIAGKIEELKQKANASQSRIDDDPQPAQPQFSPEPTRKKRWGLF